LDELEIAALAISVFHELRRAGGWLTYRKLAFRILHNEEFVPFVEAACLTRRDLFAIQSDRRVKLARPEMYAPGFDPIAAPKGLDAESPVFNEFWVYVSDWDVRVLGQGPYRAVVHRSTCAHVEGRDHKEEGVGYKNYWKSFPTLPAAIKFADSVHPWHYCSACFVT